MLSKIARYAKLPQYLYKSPVALHKRLKVYLVGIDDSSYGYSALQSVTEHVKPNDKIITYHFPLNFTYYSPTFFDEHTSNMLSKETKERQTEIEKKCKEIVKSGATSVQCEMKFGAATFQPADDLVQACFETNCDILCVGSKGLSHGLRETVSDKIHRVGHVADYCLMNAPCDVMVIKQEHDNVKMK
eukprot:208407_1